MTATADGFADGFAALDDALEKGGVDQAFETLAELLRERKLYRQLFEARLMRKRRELGLPIDGSESIRDLPAELQETVEHAYVEICREVGGLFLADGDIRGAWPYFQAIDEPARVRDAIEAWQPSHSEERALPPGDPGHYTDGVDETDAIVDIAFYQGAHPVRGYEILLSRYGTCRAVTIFEHQFPHSAEVRARCAEILVRHLYGELLAGLRADLERRGVEVAPGATVRSLTEGHPELFAEQFGYHVDLSHLQAAIRAAAGLESREDIGRAVEMCEYGRRLARDFQAVADRAPFDDFYNDYRILLRAFLGEGVDGAIRYFRSKSERAGPDETGHHFSGEVLVYLLHRTGRAREAVDAWRECLSETAHRTTLVPSFVELCRRAGDFAPALETARARDDLLQYAAALVHRESGPRP